MDASYLEEAGPTLFESALDHLNSQLVQEMDQQLDKQVEQWQTETKKNVVAKGGQRRMRKFKLIQNSKKDEFVNQYESIIRESVKDCYGTNLADAEQ